VVILALDTTTRAGSVAVARDDEVLSVVAGDAARTHGERLPDEIDHALQSAGVHPSSIGLLAVASGPGAFTSLRIGLAAMQGLAMVLNVPVIGVPTLDAVAIAAARSTPVTDAASATTIVWMDAQRGEVFAARYDPSTASDIPCAARSDAIVGLPDQVLDVLRDGAPSLFVGDAARRHHAVITHRFPGARVIDPAVALAPTIAWVGRRLAGRGGPATPHALQPIYVRRPDAELERQRRAHP
jgi:tRNA threonylcarbamoyladenosine biosynthesis protein TsaB